MDPVEEMIACPGCGCQVFPTEVECPRCARLLVPQPAAEQHAPATSTHPVRPAAVHVPAAEHVPEAVQRLAAQARDEEGLESSDDTSAQSAEDNSLSAVVEQQKLCSWGTYPVTVGGVISALPDFALATVFLVTWFVPKAFGLDTVNSLLLLMPVEFITIHSTAFMQKVIYADTNRFLIVLQVILLTLFYSLFLGAISLGFHVWWPLFSFWALTGKRILSIMMNRQPRGEKLQQIQRAWIVSTLAYIVLISVAFLPLPALGLTPENMSGVKMTGSGDLVSHPEHLMFWGLCYYGALGCSSLIDNRWFQKFDPRY